MKMVPINEVENPIAKKIIEKPERNRMVWTIAFLFKMPFSFFNSSKETPVIYERKAGYKGREQGEIKDNKPAPNAKNKLNCSNK